MSLTSFYRLLSRSCILAIVGIALYLLIVLLLWSYGEVLYGEYSPHSTLTQGDAKGLFGLDRVVNLMVGALLWTLSLVMLLQWWIMKPLPSLLRHVSCLAACMSPFIVYGAYVFHWDCVRLYQYLDAAFNLPYFMPYFTLLALVFSTGAAVCVLLTLHRHYRYH